MKQFIYLTVVVSMVLFSSSCKKADSTNNNNNNNNNTGKHNTGYNIGSENQATIPKALNTRNLSTSNTPLPSSYFLYQYLPPIGDQGQYGTCIAWSSGYYMKTALEAIDGHYTSAQLAQTSNQMSPRDLFTAIPDASKGANCEGTNFDAALTVMQSRGVATLATAPYTGLSTCAQSTLDAGWASDAANHKISTYRALNDGSITDYITDIKQNLVANTPVLVGIGVGSGFQNWTGNNVMTSGFDPCGGGGTCGGHAQCIVGYDDTKGSGGAFRIVNSWNSTWGDNGFYWVDYNFLFSTLAMKDNSGKYCLFVANNGTSHTTPPGPDPTNTVGIDLAPWVQSDINLGSGTSRSATFNIYNIGTATASTSTDWGLYYVYYNAYDANDYGIIFYDDFTNTIAANTVTCNTSGNQCQVNFDIPANSDLATVAFSSSIMHQNYSMPSITGEYYLILVADAGQKLGDINYNNNIFYASDYTTSFVNGVGKNGSVGIAPDFNNAAKPSRELLKGSSFNTAVNKKNLNAYTPHEILSFLKYKKASGELDRKVNQYLTSSAKNSGMGK